MAEVFHAFPGIPNAGAYGEYEDPLNYVFSHHADVHKWVAGQAIGRAAQAERTLAAHRDSGASSIHVESGVVDWTIWLTDRGASPVDEGNPLKSLYAIEFGRKGGRGNVGALSSAFPEVLK